MHKFKIGDKVRIVQNTTYHDFRWGDIVTIQKLVGSTNKPCYMCENAGGSSWYTYEADLEAIPEPIDLSNPNGTVFGLLPPEVQKAMKAHSGTVELYAHEGWKPVKNPLWAPSCTYRIKLAPKEETLSIVHGIVGDWPLLRVTVKRVGGVVQATAAVEVVR